MTMSRCKLTSHPLYAGMPLVGCLLLVGKKCSRPMGLNVLGGQEVRFSSTGCHRIMVSSTSNRGIGWWPRLTSLWPDELIDDITGWFDDLRSRWPDEKWWVQRIHEASASSRMTILQQVNYVLITRHDFQAFARNPHGLMELGFRNPQLHTTVLLHLINMPIIRTFLVPLWTGIRSGLTPRASLNGMTLDHQLIAAESGFYLSVSWEGSPSLVSQIEHMAISHTQQLHRHSTIITGGYIHNGGTTVYILGGNRLIFSRKINLIGPNLQRDIEGALRARFPDLAQDNFDIGLVHLSYYLTEPVADFGWEIRLVIPVVEDDTTPVILFKAVLSTYEGLGAIYVPPTINKHILITETGLDIVCGPQGDVCLLPQWFSVGVYSA